MNKHIQLKQYARELRKNGTPGEAILWKHVLRAKQFYGLQFNRQFIIENYIVDFVCREIKLVIELDGKYHDHISSEDKARDNRLNELGFKVLRIPEKLVIEDVNAVYHYLKKYIPEEIKNKYDGQSP